MLALMPDEINDLLLYVKCRVDIIILQYLCKRFLSVEEIIRRSTVNSSVLDLSSTYYFWNNLPVCSFFSLSYELNKHCKYSSPALT